MTIVAALARGGALGETSSGSAWRGFGCVDCSVTILLVTGYSSLDVVANLVNMSWHG
ncbi:hypothetical protein JCM18918_2643 [Cutibacterium acnes JCM 18918]|nr:hypothetical protein JCM18918_2643 [Cutibacterium acnes JCM 18918]